MSRFFQVAAVGILAIGLNSSLAEAGHGHRRGGHHHGGYSGHSVGFRGGYSYAPQRYVYSAPTYYPAYSNPPIYHDDSHYDYHAPTYYRHGNHFHYQPGHYDFHQSGHWHR